MNSADSRAFFDLRDSLTNWLAQSEYDLTVYQNAVSLAEALMIDWEISQKETNAQAD